MADLVDQLFDHDVIETRIDYAFNWDSDAQAFRVTDQRIEDTDATAAHKGVRFGEPVELYYTRDGATARDAMTRRLFRRKKAPRYVSVRTNLLGLENELADPMRLTHYNGLGPDGDVNTPGFIVKHRVDPNTFAVTLTMLDMRRMGSLLTAGAGGAGGGVATITLSAPPVTRVATATRAAGANTLTLTAPPVVVVIGSLQTLAAGTNRIVFTVPAVSVQPIVAGAAVLSLTAPTAIAAPDDALLSDAGDGAFLTTETGTDVLTED